jgi:hypothetical protein
MGRLDFLAQEIAWVRVDVEDHPVAAAVARDLKRVDAVLGSRA